MKGDIKEQMISNSTTSILEQSYYVIQLHKMNFQSIQIFKHQSASDEGENRKRIVMSSL